MANDEYEGLSSSFAAACRKADAKHFPRAWGMVCHSAASKPKDPHFEWLRSLLDEDTYPSFDAVYAEINRAHLHDRAAASTVEALMLGLRERGIAAVQEPKVRARLAQLSQAQLIEVGDRLQRLKPEIARAWSADHVIALARVWKDLRS